MRLSFIRFVCLVFAVLLPLQSPSLAQDQNLKDKIVCAVLDHSRLAVVKVGTTGVTSLEFPYKIEAIDGYGFSATPGSGDAFQISYTKGTNFFSVRALKTGVCGNVTVVLDQKLYSIFFKESNDPSFVNIFSLPGEEASPAPVEQVAADKKQSATPAQLAGLLNTAKNYETLRTTCPEMLAGLHVTEPGRQTSLGKDVTSSICRLLEDQALGSLAVEVQIANRSNEDFCYDPEVLQIKAQNRVYDAVLHEASGLVKARTSETVYFVVNQPASEQRNNPIAEGDLLLAARNAAHSRDSAVAFDQPTANYLPTAMTVAEPAGPPALPLTRSPVERPTAQSKPPAVKPAAAKKVQKKSEPKPDPSAKNTPAKVEKPAPKKLFGWL
jgi:hypothetical protein